jgi:hypothetical protein
MTDPYSLTIIEEHTEPTTLTDLVEQIHPILTDRAQQLEVPPFHLTVVLSGNLTASVIQRGEVDSQPERVGGVVHGKTLNRTDDYAEVDMVLDATPAEWTICTSST